MARVKDRVDYDEDAELQARIWNGFVNESDQLGSGFFVSMAQMSTQEDEEGFQGDMEPKLRARS